MTFPRYLDLAGLRWNFVASHCRQTSSVIQSLFKKPRHLKLVADYSTILSSYRAFPALSANYERNMLANNMPQGLYNKDFFFSNIIILNGNNLLLKKKQRTALRLWCCFLKVILADGLFLFLFTCTAQDNNKIGHVFSSHNFLIVFGKRLIVRYWSASVRWCK